MTVRLRLVPLVVLGGFLAWYAGERSGLGDPVPLALLMLGVLGVLIVSRPQLAAILVVGLGGTVLPDRFGPLAFGTVRTDVVELMEFALIGSCAVACLVGHLKIPRLLAPWLLFELAVVVGLVVGGSHGTSTDVLVGSGKDYARYLLAPTFAAIFVSNADKDLLERWLLRFCDLGTAFTALGATLHVSLSSQFVNSQIYTLGTASEAERIRTPLLGIIGLALLLVLGRTLDQGLTPSRAARLAAYPFPILLSFNRSTWIPMFLAVVLLGVLRRGERLPGRGLVVTLGLSLGGAVLVIGSLQGTLGQTAHAVIVRASSTVSPDLTRDLSYTDRKEESQKALAAAARSPLTGLGVGRPYGARRAEYRTDPPRLVYYDRIFTHNTYLGIWLQTGLIGLLAVALLGWRLVREVRAAMDRLPPKISTRHLAAGLSIGVIAGSALLQTSLGDRPTVLGLSCAFALLVRPGQS